MFGLVTWHPTSLWGSTNVPLAIVFGFCLLFALWLYLHINIVFQRAIHIKQIKTLFLYLINNQDAFHQWQVEEYYFTNIILSCPLGDFGAVFQPPSRSAAGIKGPCCLDCRDYSGYSPLSAGHLSEPSAANHEYEGQDYPFFVCFSLLCCLCNFPLTCFSREMVTSLLSFAPSYPCLCFSGTPFSEWEI